MHIPSKVDLAWAAGIFEGEGSVGHARGCPVIHVNMTDKDIIEKLYGIMKFGNIGGPYTHSRNPNFKPSWAWRVQGGQFLQIVMGMFWPWLGVRRKAQLKRALEAWLSTPISNKHKIYCSNGHPFEVICKTGVRGCRICINQRRRERYHEKRKGSETSH